MCLKVLVFQWIFLFCGLNHFNAELTTENPNEKLLNIRATVNGKVNISSIELIKSEAESFVAENGTLADATTTQNYEEIVKSISHPENRDDISSNVTNLLNERTSVEVDQQSSNSMSDSDLGIFWNSDNDTITTNRTFPILEFTDSVTEMDVKEENEAVERGPTDVELRMLNDEPDNIAVEDIDSIIKIDPELQAYSDDINEHETEEDLPDMESIFDERKFRHIKQNSNKNLKEIKIFFSETEGDFPYEDKNYIESTTQSTKKAKSRAMNQEGTKVTKSNKKNRNQKHNPFDDKTKDAYSSDDDDIYSIINSIKRTLENDKLKGYKITAISTKKVPAKPATDSTTDSKVLEFSVKKLPMVNSTLNNTKIGLDPIIQSNQFPTTTEQAFNESKSAPYSTKESSQFATTTEEILNPHGRTISISSISSKFDNESAISSLEPSSRDVEDYYNKQIDENYESLEDDSMTEVLVMKSPPVLVDDVTSTTNQSVLNDSLTNNHIIMLHNAFLNIPMALSITIGTKDEIMYVPSDAHINENSNVINITWRGSYNLNNSIVLRLTEYDSYYLIREIQINFPSANGLLTQKKAVAIIPPVSETGTDSFKKEQMRDGTFIQFSNVDFLKKMASSRDAAESSTINRMRHIEIASICSACAILLAASIYILTIKVKGKWFRKTKETNEERETQC